MWSLLRTFKGEIAFLFVISLIANLLFLTSPWYMMQIADKVFVYRSMETLTLLTSVLLWLFLIMGLLEFVRGRIMAGIAFRAESTFYNKLYQGLLIQSADGKIETPEHYITDINQIRQFVSGEGFFGLFDLFWMPIYLVVLWFFSWKLACFAVLMASISLIVSLITHRLGHREYEHAHGLGYEANNELISQLRNLSAIKSMGMIQGAQQRWLEKQMASIESYFIANEQLSLWYSLSKNFRYVSMTLIMATSAFLVIENELTVGMMAASGLLLGRVIMPIDALGNALKNIAQIEHSLERLHGLMSQRDHAARYRPLVDPSQGLTLAQLTVLTENGERLLLNDITFSLPPASCLVILGPNGAGKTTLIRTLAGLVTPTSGKITFAGTNLAQVHADHIGYVPQDVTLIEGSLAQNICRFGKIDDQKMITAGQLVGIHDFIMTLKDGYHTQVGHQALHLSGGQKQMIALARAIYNAPECLLLDEPNSSLDKLGQQSLLTSINAMKQQGSSVIVSTHQYSLLPFADYILTLDHGQVVLFESRQSLIERLQAGTPS
jgi:PrtD family type I secretion system ABC transporter